MHPTVYIHVYNRSVDALLAFTPHKSSHKGLPLHVDSEKLAMRG